MRIEQPDQPLPLHITGGGIAAYPAAQQISGDFASIGDFYTALFQQIASFAKQGDIFTGSPSNQVTPATTGTTWYDRLDWFPIKNLDDVQKGIQVIISQGEGADNTPADLDGNPSHFYRFGQIYWGRKLIPDTTSEYGWSYTGPAVMLETSDVLPMPANMKVSDYEPGTRAAVLTSQFSQAYMQVLNLMQQAFNGNPQMLNGAIRLMFQLRIMAYEVLTQPYPTDTAPVIGLTFEYSSIIT